LVWNFYEGKLLAEGKRLGCKILRLDAFATTKEVGTKQTFNKPNLGVFDRNKTDPPKRTI